ncbi:chemokine-like receptor 1 [Plectropomus leopardus]|uniref:chemokine-like receptor 1 n=1 Tax=Plectropomus leopardus TaxID=160734 RepID=UPI001C4BD90E|nr:chemokine-like receptor 1 [Plectropomus leopardus]
MGTDNMTSNVRQQTGIAEIRKNVLIFCLVVYCVIFLVGTLGNGLVIYVTGCRMKRTVNSVWFLNLALADFLFTTFLIFSIISAAQDHQWQFGLLMCRLNTFVAVVNMFASIFLLTAISLDRVLSVWVVVWAQNKRTVCKAQIICTFIWICAMICSTPYSIFRETQKSGGVIHCGYTRSMSFEQMRSLGIFRFVVGFFIPFVVIFVSYVAISVRARRLQRNRKHRPRRIIFSIILAFFICWLPFHILHFIELKARATNDPELRNVVIIVGPLTLSLGFLNSCLNPILYVFMCDEFQKKLRQSICFVLENALAEDHLSFMSSRSLSSHFSRITRKSDSTAPPERKGTATSLDTESKVVITAETDTMSTE